MSWPLVFQCSCFDKRYRDTFFLAPAGWRVLASTSSAALVQTETTVSESFPLSPADAPRRKIRTMWLNLKGKRSRRDHRPPDVRFRRRKRRDIIHCASFALTFVWEGNGKGEKEMGHILKPFYVTGIKLTQKGIKSA